MSGVTPRPSEAILHVDMDAFFASVEQHDDPALVGHPVVVGSPTGRGVVAAASYEARAFGIRSAMPMVRARRLCPGLVVLRPRFGRYQEVSDHLMRILRDVTPNVEPLSLDEAFLDVAGSERIFGDPVKIAAAIRHRVRRELGLSCSVGIGSTKSVAKLLSGLAKPDGLMHWPAAEVVERLRPLPVNMLWGAGPRTTQRLTEHGFFRIGDVADADPQLLQRLLGPSLGEQLHALARGVDPREVQPRREPRSVSAETTFDDDVDDPVLLERRLQNLVTGVARRLRAQGLAARTITVKMRLADHRDLTKSVTLRLATDRTHELVYVAREALHVLHRNRLRVRLLGFRASGLAAPGPATQLAMLDDMGRASGSDGGVPGERWASLDRAADAIAARYGSPLIGFAAFLEDQNEHAPED